VTAKAAETENRLPLYRRPCCVERVSAVMRTQMRTAQRDSIPIAWTLWDAGHQGLVEFAHCRSDLFRASS
jgi:hypothetical protein